MNESTTNQILWDAAREVLTENVIALNECFGKRDINH